MTKSNIKGYVNSIESMGLVDGPGIRCVVFLEGCNLRCKYCHNPEMWIKKEANYTARELVKKIIRFKPYFKNNGGVTFSGGEPLLQSEFIIEVCKLLKEENINIALDTAGVGNGNYEELLKYIDLVIFDVKHVEKDEYKKLTLHDNSESEMFLQVVQNMNKKLWIRQVIIPGVNDNIEYLEKLNIYLKDVENIEKIEFLPYHTLALNKYQKLNIDYFYKDKKDMNKDICNNLYTKFLELRTRN